jgi:hypothetical protein
MLQLANSSFQVLGNIQRYHNFTHVRRFYDLNTFELNIPSDIDTDYVKNNIILYTFGTKVYPLVINNLHKSTDSKTTTVSGCAYSGIDRRSVVDVLHRNQVYGELTNNVSTLMENLMISECISPFNGGRTIPYLTNTTMVLGGTTTYQLSFQPLRTSLNELSLFGDVGYEIFWTGSSAVFNCYQGNITPCVFSDSLNNLKNAVYTDGIEVNCTYTLGSTNVARYTTSDDTVSGMSRYEDTDQASSTTVAVSAFENTLAEKRKQQSRITAEVLDSVYTYGTDFNIGDLITIEAYGKTFYQRVTEVVESYSQSEGTSYEIKVGYPLPLLEDKIREKFKYLDNYIYRVYKMAGGV